MNAENYARNTFRNEKLRYYSRFYSEDAASNNNLGLIQLDQSCLFLTPVSNYVLFGFRNRKKILQKNRGDASNIS